MSQGFYTWSKTTAANASADASINWAEGQAPSSVNDSARAMMARIAEYRDDIAGAIVTGGTSTAYTLATNQVFSSSAVLHQKCLAFTPHVTNGAGPVSLNVDGIGVKSLRSAPGVELPAGVLIQGTPYVVTFIDTDVCFYLHNFYGNPYNIPLGGFLAYAGSSAPNGSFALPSGQAISRTTFASLFSLIGATYGAGDGSTTFNIPDLRGRGIFFKDNMNGTPANRITVGSSGIDAVNLSASGGAQSVGLVTANLPPYTPSGVVTNGAITVSMTPGGVLGGTISGVSGGSTNGTPIGAATIGATASQAPTSFAGNAQGGTSTAVQIMPPAYILNCIMRII